MRILSIIFLTCFVVGFIQCSSKDEEIEIRRKPVETVKPGDAGSEKWNDIKDLVDEKCSKCHNGATHPKTFDTLLAYKIPAVKNRITNDTMPPGGGLDDETKSKLLSVW